MATTASATTTVPACVRATPRAPRLALGPRDFDITKSEVVESLLEQVLLGPSQVVPRLFLQEREQIDRLARKLQVDVGSALGIWRVTEVHQHRMTERHQ